MFLRMTPKTGFALTIALLVFGLFFANSAFAANGARSEADPRTAHGIAWAFGNSPDRQSSIWIKGIGAEDISNNARPKIFRKNAADTSNGIDAALRRAGKKSRTEIDLKMKNETSNWKSTPAGNYPQADEKIAREGRHILGAYAGVKATQDLNINLGPEIIIKDEQNVHESSNASQPDAALGLGMNFKLDF